MSKKPALEFDSRFCFARRSRSAGVVAYDKDKIFTTRLAEICTGPQHSAEQEEHGKDSINGYSKKMVRLEGMEPPTCWFVASRSVQLSYSPKILFTVYCPLYPVHCPLFHHNAHAFCRRPHWPPQQYKPAAAAADLRESLSSPSPSQSRFCNEKTTHGVWLIVRTFL